MTPSHTVLELLSATLNNSLAHLTRWGLDKILLHRSGKGRHPQV
jgi:hypothetical protein